MSEKKENRKMAFVLSGEAQKPTVGQLLIKAIADGGEVSSKLREQEDALRSRVFWKTDSSGVIPPNIPPDLLSKMVAQNNALAPCIDAMVTNISGTGFEIVHKYKSEAELTDEEIGQRDRLENFFSEVDNNASLTLLRKDLRRDRHETGNSYMVVERALSGDIAFLRRAKAKSMRIVESGGLETVTVSIRGQDFKTRRSRRRFIQEVGAEKIYYKEWGDEGDLDYQTGKWYPQNSLPAERRAHEIIFSKDLEDVDTPYGVPRWLCQLPSVLGSRRAEERNLGYFETGGIPPAMIFVTGGVVSQELANAIESFMNTKTSNVNKLGVFEIPGSGDIDGERPGKVEVVRFDKAVSGDADFLNYDEGAEAKIRRSFRLPKLFVGMTDDVNYASAIASIQVTEDQVFGPDRKDEDDLLNTTIMRELDETGAWRLRSKPIRVKDVLAQIRALELASNVPGTILGDVVSELCRVADLDVGTDDEERIAGAVTAPQEPVSNVSLSAKARTVSLRVKRYAQDLMDFDDPRAAQELLSIRDDYGSLSEDERERVGLELKKALPAFASGGTELARMTGADYAITIFGVAEQVAQDAG